MAIKNSVLDAAGTKNAVLDAGGTKNAVLINTLFYWVNADADGLWNNANNFSTSSGGTGGAGVPGSDDTVIFDGGNTDDCRLDASLDIAVLDMQSGYTGTIDGATDNLNHAISGDMTLDGTRFDMGDGTYTVGGNFDNKDVTTFNRNLGTLVLAGTDKTVEQGDDFYNVTVSGSYTVVGLFFDCRNDVIVSGTVIVNSGMFFSLFGSGSLSVTGTGNITGTGSLKVLNGVSVSQQDGVIDVAAMSFEGTGTLIPATYAPTTFRFFSTTVTTFTPTAGTYTFSNNLTINTSGGGQLTWAGNTNNPTINVAGNVVMALGGASTIVSMGSGAWTVEGDWDSSTITTLNKNAAVLNLSGAGAGTQTITSGGKDLPAIVINDSGAIKQFIDDLTATSILVTDGEVDFNKKTFDLDANLTINGTTGATVSLTGLAAAVFNVGGNTEFNGTMSGDLAMNAASDWFVNGVGTVRACFTDLAHSDASGGSQGVAAQSVDSGDNVNWTFANTGIDKKFGWRNSDSKERNQFADTWGRRFETIGTN